MSTDLEQRDRVTRYIWQHIFATIKRRSTLEHNQERN